MTTSADLVKRFTPTPLEVFAKLSGMTIHLATNSGLLIDRLKRIETSSTPGSPHQSACAWRIVAEPDEDFPRDNESLPFHCISDEGLSFVSMGRQGFFAFDQRAGAGIAFISETFVRDGELFQSYFLPILTSLLPKNGEAL